MDQMNYQKALDTKDLVFTDPNNMLSYQEKRKLIFDFVAKVSGDVDSFG